MYAPAEIDCSPLPEYGYCFTANTGLSLINLADFATSPGHSNDQCTMLVLLPTDHQLG